MEITLATLRSDKGQRHRPFLAEGRTCETITGLESQSHHVRLGLWQRRAGRGGAGQGRAGPSQAG